MSTVARRTNPVSEMLDWLESGPGLSLRTMGNYIRVEDFTEEGSYVLRAELPGVDPDKDIGVTVEGDVLTVHGERREEERDKNHSEFHYGSFSRSVRLPRTAKAEDVTATYRDGVLEVRLPLGPEPTGATHVPVQRSGR